VCVVLRVGVLVEQVAWVEVQPARVLVEVEVDRDAGRRAGAVVLARRQRLVRVVAHAEYRVLVLEFDPLRRTRCMQRKQERANFSISLVSLHITLAAFHAAATMIW